MEIEEIIKMLKDLLKSNIKTVNIKPLLKDLIQQSKEFEKLKEENRQLSNDNYHNSNNLEIATKQNTKLQEKLKEFENGVKDLGLNNNDTTKFGDGFEEAIFEVKQLLTKTV